MLIHLLPSFSQNHPYKSVQLNVCLFQYKVQKETSAPHALSALPGETVRDERKKKEFKKLEKKDGKSRQHLHCVFIWKCLEYKTVTSKVSQNYNLMTQIIFGVQLFTIVYIS